MSDSVLPMSIDEMESKTKEDEPVEMEVEEKEIKEEDWVDEQKEEEIEKKPMKEIFEDLPVEPVKKGRKKRKPMSEDQKAKLAKAREISAQRRKAVKEAKMIETESKKLARKKRLEDKLEKKLEDEALIQYKAKIMAEAKEKSGWDEEKLIGLMTKTIDSYIERKKALKPVPRVTIPNKPAYPQYSPLAQPQAPHQQQNYYQQPAPPRASPSHQNRQTPNDPYHTLFGFGTG